MSTREALITGIGPVSSLGNGREAFWTELTAGRSGITEVVRESDDPGLCRVGAQVADPAPLPFDPTRPIARAVPLARKAAELAWHDAGLGDAAVDRERVGVVVGTSIGNLDLIERFVRQIVAGEAMAGVMAFRSFAHAAAVAIVDALDARGPMSTVSTGCNSGLDAIAVGLDWIRLGDADVVVAGGAEAELCPAFLVPLEAGRGLATGANDRPAGASRPFDKNRGGNVPGEGAGFVVLESAEHARRRGVRGLARLASVASLSAGKRPRYAAGAAPDDTEPMVRTMRAALDRAGLHPDDISAVSANGSSSVAYDPLEARAYRELLGERAASVPVFSIKGALGQTGACTPAFQVIAAALALRHRTLPPTLNHDDPIDGLGLDIVTAARPMEASSVLVHAIGFGGAYNVSAVLRACA